MPLSYFVISWVFYPAVLTISNHKLYWCNTKPSHYSHGRSLDTIGWNFPWLGWCTAKNYLSQMVHSKKPLTNPSQPLHAPVPISLGFVLFIYFPWLLKFSCHLSNFYSFPIDASALVSFIIAFQYTAPNITWVWYWPSWIFPLFKRSEKQCLLRGETSVDRMFYYQSNQVPVTNLLPLLFATRQC